MSRFYVGTTEVIEFVYRRIESTQRKPSAAPILEPVDGGLREIQRGISVRIRELEQDGK